MYSLLNVWSTSYPGIRYSVRIPEERSSPYTFPALIFNVSARLPTQKVIKLNISRFIFCSLIVIAKITLFLRNSIDSYCFIFVCILDFSCRLFQQILDRGSLIGRSVLHDIIPVRDRGCISSRLKGTLVKFSCMDQAKMKDNWSSPSRWLPVDFPLTSHWLINEIPVQVYWDSLLSPSHCTKNWSLSSSSPIACNGGGRLTILSFLL